MVPRPTFYGLETAKSGLFISQKGLDVTAHNISNVNTAGYTRQRLVTTAIDPYSNIMKFKSVEVGQVGQGVEVMILDQIRDSFLDRQFRSEQTIYSEWAVKSQGLSYVESLLEEDDEYSLRNTMGDLFDSFDNLVLESSGYDQRVTVRSAAENFIANLNHVYNRMVDMHAEQNTAVETTVAGINTILSNITELNESIYFYERDGQPANDLRDKRNLLLDELSALIDIEYEETVDRHFVLSVGGAEVVNHITQQDVGFIMEDNPITGAVDDLFVPAVGGVALTVTGGELRGHLDLRDNDTPDDSGLPYFIEQLNILARALVKEVNDQHKLGWTHPGSGQPSQQGVAFFDETFVTGTDYSGVTAGNIALSADILGDVYNIAASLSEIDLSQVDNANAGDQQNAMALFNLINSTTLDNISSFNGFIAATSTELATTLNHAKTMQSNQSTLVLSVDNQRTSISGVSLDEEMTNLLMYQHAFSGASRVITTMDEAIDTIVNRMGLVGRS